jgi:hypothetical protein
MYGQQLDKNLETTEPRAASARETGHEPPACGIT